MLLLHLCGSDCGRLPCHNPLPPVTATILMEAELYIGPAIEGWRGDGGETAAQMSQKSSILL